MCSTFEFWGSIDVESKISIKTQKAALKTFQKIQRQDIEDIFSFDISDSDGIIHFFPTIPLLTENKKIQQYIL